MGESEWCSWPFIPPDHPQPDLPPTSAGQALAGLNDHQAGTVLIHWWEQLE